MTAGTQQQPLQPSTLKLGTLASRSETNLPPLVDSGSAAAPSAGSMQWARGVLDDVAPALAGNLVVVRVLREGPKRLALLELSTGRRLVLKQYSDDQGVWTRRWLQRLAEAGFAPPARFAVTREQGWSATYHTLVTDLAAGNNWAHWLHAEPDARDAAAVAAADWLARLQSLQIALPERTTHRAGAELCRQSGRLAEQYPRHAIGLLQVTQAAHRCLYRDTHAPNTGLVASHGDLHPENLYISAGRPLAVTAIDLDTAGLRRPSYDVGYALSQLLIVSWMRTGSFRSGACAALVFWDRWLAHGGPDAEAVPAEVVRTLMQSLHFELLVYRTGRNNLVQRWLGIAGEVLANGVRATLQALATGQEGRS